MNRIDDYTKLTCDIVSWICKYVNDNQIKSLVVGVSGGVDSAVTSTLCAKTGLPVYAVGMPLDTKIEQETLSDAQLFWLSQQHRALNNVNVLKPDLSESYAKYIADLAEDLDFEYISSPMSKANTKSRFRMMTLYHIAANVNGIVVGTGNKVEDYGIGFFTKHGDGGVDIAPIAALYKTEVWELGRHLKIIPDILNALPTDGLWDDQRTDEDQIGAKYSDLEEAMEKGTGSAVEIYKKFNRQNMHKMSPTPTFKLGES